MLRPLEKHKAFPEISRPYSAEFRRSTYILEAGAGIGVEDLLDPTRWNRQPHLRRFDIIEVIAADNRFAAAFLVESMTSGFPMMRLLWSSTVEIQAEDATAPDRIEYHIADQWVVIINNEIVASGFDDQAAAEMELAKRLAVAA